MKAVANLWRLEAEKPDEVWNPKKRKWTKPTSQTGYKTLKVREMFIEMKDEVNKSWFLRVASNLLDVMKSFLKQDNW